jgi:hypothetical protein
MTVLVATPQYLTRYGAPESPEELKRFRSVVFVERGSVQPWSFGSGQDAKRVIPTGGLRTSDIEQMRMGVLEHILSKRGAEPLRRPLVFAAVFQLPWRPQPASFGDRERWLR